jgi:hypothetical protein
MLIAEVGVHTMQVHTSRRRGFLMLAMMALWTMLPVSACLQASHPMGQHACCHGMTQACDSSAMDASGSCCLVHRQSAAIAPTFADAVDHLQALAVASHPAILPVPHAKSARREHSLALPPSILSSAGSSILRI